MLHEFIAANRQEVITRCRAMISTRPAPRPTDAELEHGVPIFLDQVMYTLSHAFEPNANIGRSATKHGAELLNRGFTIAQVVHDYGGVCQAITELAVEKKAPISAAEFQTLNLCLDDAIAGAVTEYCRLRDYDGHERLGRLAHELRNMLGTATLAFELLQKGSVGVNGSTGAVMARSLVGLRHLIDCEVAEVRLSASPRRQQTVAMREFMEDIEVASTLEATCRGLHFTVATFLGDVTVSADRQILLSVVGNLLQNAFKFTRPGGHVWLRGRVSPERVYVDVEDQCGGLPPGMADDPFKPYEQRSTDQTGLGLGLSICDRGARACGGEVRVYDAPGIGCRFTLDLPRSLPPS